ncbi:MAG: Gfo/Idh/MocA family oxidoreductase [Anaerolineae bacterium]|nr:Gfo/Idh/MocA family oxidoreductase [Thermoflexales bacterium]MDW8407964.1 Gfo/Idh/MocA family oxidoreductase [Anaerolineae bacterium]
MNKRIGFVDDHLDNFHANIFLKIVREDLVERGFTIAGCLAIKARQGRAWAGKNGVPYFSDLDEMNAAVDAYMILAPSNPEVHLELCERVLPYGKPTYIDKTFAPDLKTARRIFALADRYKTPVQTTSALRYTDVQKYVGEVGRAAVQHMIAWGGGRSFGEYAIHPVELVVSCMGPKAQRLMRCGSGRQSQLLLDLSGGRTAVINVYTQSDTPFAAAVTTQAGTRYIPVDHARLFVDAMAAILDFFEAGHPTIDRAETLAIRRILDVATSPRALKRFVSL